MAGPWRLVIEPLALVPGGLGPGGWPWRLVAGPGSLALVPRGLVLVAGPGAWWLAQRP